MLSNDATLLPKYAISCPIWRLMTTSGVISLRPLEPGTKFAETVSLDAIERIVPEQEIEAVLDETLIPGNSQVNIWLQI